MLNHVKTQWLIGGCSNKNSDRFQQPIYTYLIPKKKNSELEGFHKKSWVKTIIFNTDNGSLPSFHQPFGFSETSRRSKAQEFPNKSHTFPATRAVERPEAVQAPTRRGAPDVGLCLTKLMT